MNNRKIKKIIKKHISLMKDDNFRYEDISNPPSWLTETREQLKEERYHKKRTRIWRWGPAAVGAFAMFVFMLSPAGQAVSGFLYSIDIQWNKEQTSLEIGYKGNTSQESFIERPEENLETKKTFSNIEAAKEVYPTLVFVRNDAFVLENIEINGLGTSSHVILDYSFGESVVTVSQNIFYTEIGAEYFTDLTETAVSVETSFNRGRILVYGGYEEGYGNAMAIDGNCEYSFICENMPLDAFTEFIEGCYIE